MDDKGYWHDRAKEDLVAAFTQDGEPRRFVIDLGVGEVVRIEKDADATLRARFESANGNKITLVPIDEVRPYLEFAEHVSITNERDVTVRAQVWDNRKGKIILRTLPV